MCCHLAVELWVTLNGTLGCFTVSLKTNLPPFIVLTLKVIRNTLLQSKHK